MLTMNQKQLYVCIRNKNKNNMTTKTNKTHKVAFAQWRVNVLNALNMKHKIISGQIIYKGTLENSLVNFLVSKRLELGINPY